MSDIPIISEGVLFHRTATLDFSAFLSALAPSPREAHSRLRSHYFILPSGETQIFPIQGDSGGKVNILRCDSVGHCEERNSCERV